MSHRKNRWQAMFVPQPVDCGPLAYIREAIDVE